MPAPAIKGDPKITPLDNGSVCCEVMVTCGAAPTVAWSLEGTSNSDPFFLTMSVRPWIEHLC